MVENPYPPRRPQGPWPLLIAIGLACLVGGFVVGWLTRGDGGTAAVLPTVEAPAPGTTTGVTSTAKPPSATADLPKPDAIALVILNGTDVTGLAAQTVDRASKLGYVDPVGGNAPTTAGPTVVYFRPGRRPEAQRVAADLGFKTIKAFPTTGALTTAAPPAGHVVVVLGPGG